MELWGANERASEGGVRKGGVAIQKHIFPLPVCPDLIYATKPEFKMLDFSVRVYYPNSSGCPLNPLFPPLGFYRYAPFQFQAPALIMIRECFSVLHMTN